MLTVLTFGSRLQCQTCGLSPTLRPPLVQSTVGGHTILTEADLQAATLSCTRTGPGVKPCMKIVTILDIGRVRALTVAKQVPLLSSVKAMTDGVPPAYITAVHDEGSRLVVSIPSP